MELGKGDRQGSRLHRDWKLILIGLITVAIVWILVSYSESVKRERIARQDEIRGLEDRISDAEEKIRTLEKSNTFAEAMIAQEEKKARVREESRERLEKLREGQRQIEAADKYLCDTTLQC